MNREVHVQFFERARVRFPCATHPFYLQALKEAVSLWIEAMP